MSAPISPVDRLSSLLERFQVQAELHHAGLLCGVQHFDASDGHGYLHVLRRGELELTLPRAHGVETVHLDQPALLLNALPLTHRFRHAAAAGSDFSCARIHFVGGPQNPLARALPPLIMLPLATLPELAPALDLLFSELDRARCGQRLLVGRIFEVILIQLLRWLLDHPDQAGVPPGLITGLSDPRLARALSAMHESPGAPWTLERMASHAGMSRTAFAGRFREVVGQTPADYLGGWRIVLAQSRLRDGMSIKQLADELGYANPSALSRAFTARVGCSPREWIRAPGPAGREPLRA